MSCAQETARESARANAEANRATSLQTQLMTAQQALAAARVDVEAQRTRSDALEAELKAAGADHVRERTRAADDAEREARGLRSQVATLVGNQQYMESSLNRARCVRARTPSTPPSLPASARSRRPHSCTHSRWR